jgi:hypothetical protein
MPYPDPATLRPVDPAAFEQAIEHALQFDGRKKFHRPDTFMAKITAAHLAECFRRSGYVIMQEPPAVMASVSIGNPHLTE